MQREVLKFRSIPNALTFLMKREQELDHQVRVELDNLCVRWVKREVLRRMAEGYSRTEISRETRLSQREVDEAIALLKDQHKSVEVDLEPLRRQFREAGVELKK